MSTQANFASAPLGGGITISTANTARDGSGTLGTVLTAGAAGARIDTLAIKAQGTTTAGMVRLFVHDGTAARLVAEVPVVAAAPGAAVPSWGAVMSTGVNVEFPIVLQPTHSLRASTHNAEAFNVVPLQAGSF